MEISSTHEQQPAAPTPKIDWVAYKFLQQLTFKTNDPFEIEALDYALDKVLDAVPRSATGIQLAKDFFRDGKRYFALRRKTTGKHYLSSLYFTELFCGNEITIHGMPNLQNSINIVSNTINKLPGKEKDALILKLTDNDNELTITNKLGIGIRQYRNLMRNCKGKLRATAGFKEACENLQFLEVADESDYNIFSMLKKLSINAAIAA